MKDSEKAHHFSILREREMHVLMSDSIRDTHLIKIHKFLVTDSIFGKIVPMDLSQNCGSIIMFPLLWQS